MLINVFKQNMLLSHTVQMGNIAISDLVVMVLLVDMAAHPLPGDVRPCMGHKRMFLEFFKLVLTFPQ